MTDEKKPVYKPHTVKPEFIVNFDNFKSGFDGAKVVQLDTDNGFVFSKDNELLAMINKRIVVLPWFNPMGYTDEQLVEKANNLVPAFLKK